MTTTIPKYALYGDAGQPAWLDMVHVEHIHERSSMFDYDIAPHVHDGLIQILYLSSGGGWVTIDGTRWQLFPQSLIVIPAGHVHGFQFSPDIDGPVVTAAQRPLESLAGVATPGLLAAMRKPLVADAAAAPRHAEALMPLFEAIARETRLHASGQTSAGAALLLALMVQIQRVASSQPAPQTAGADAVASSRKAAQVERYRALVDAQFKDRWPIERYAAEMGVSAGQLSRLCRDVLGQSALDVLNARIVHEAERELVYSTLGIKQIAGLLGFADDAYFGRFFRKQTGRTPSAFREAARARLAPTP